jgi:hypothetical protein
VGGELGVSVVEQAAWWFVVKQAQVAELLGGPEPVWSFRDVPEDDPADTDLDEEQDVVGSQGGRGDGEEVTGPDELGVLTEEVVPAQTP